MQQVRNIKEIETAIGQYGEIVVSKNKKNNVVIMSMEEYRKKLLDKQIENKLIESEKDIESGRVREAEEVFEEWQSKYGI